MNAADIRPLVDAIKKCVSRHELPQKGAYGRWLWEGGVWGDGGAPRALGKNPYGCADAANILYTVNDFDCDEETCRTRIRELQVMQDPETGMFHESTHDPIHTTAHCLGALQLFDDLLSVFLHRDDLYMLHGKYSHTSLFPSHQNVHRSGNSSFAVRLRIIS